MVRALAGGDPVAGQPFVWVPQPHAFQGFDRLSCSARVEDEQGFRGVCGERFSSQVHVRTGGPAAAGVDVSSAPTLIEQVQRQMSKADPEDHVSKQQLEDFLLHYGKLDRLEAQRIAHLVSIEYDLFPKGLLLIHKGLDR